MMTGRKKENRKFWEGAVMKLYSNYSHRDTCPEPGGSGLAVNSGSELEHKISLHKW